MKIGDIVKFKTREGEVEPAIVTRTHGPECVSLLVLPFSGSPYAATSVSIGDRGHYVIKDEPVNTASRG